ncbi:MAG: leucine-rich repeat domain-containing protein, partial [Clostridia bacterium]|nr:leucine-rich repeat domain-containing protein [Clostridia bacterium]
MKKLFCAAGAACLLAACVFSGCNLGDATVSFTLSEDGTHYSVSVDGNVGALTEFEIPAEYSPEEGGQALPVTEIADFAFLRCNNLSSVTIPNSVTHIGQSAFAFSGLESVEIPSSVTHIGYGAFGSCIRLTEVTVPASVTELSPLAFAYCTKLEKVYVKANITVLENKVFYNSYVSEGGEIYTNTSLKKVYLPATLEKIHMDALGGNAITDIYFAGTKEQWNSVYFYTTQLKEGKKDEYEEVKVEKNQVIPQ